MDQYNNNYQPNGQVPPQGQPQYQQQYQQTAQQQFQQAQQQYQQYPGYQPKSAKDKTVAGLLAIFLGSLGIHKFYLGYNTAGIIMLLVSLLTCGIGATVMAIIGIVEGIMYLTKDDGEFQAVYVQGEKQWF